MTYEIYVIANSGLFKEGLNAIAAFCRSSGFEAATWIGSAIGIMMTAYGYTKDKDLVVYLKWLASYMLVFNVLLGTTSTVAIINTTDQTVPAQIVDGVPFGIAFPAHLITAFGHEFTEALETAFSMPDETQYHKTGMLFGSNLFNLSLAAKMDDPEVMREMNDYVRSCVIGDIMINHKYTFNDLLHSNDLWGLMTRQSSQIRGMFIDNGFVSCKQAAIRLTNEMDDYASKKAPANLSRFIPTSNAYAGTAVSTMLENSYQYFKAASKTGTEILKQNIAINAFRSGIKNYAGEVGSVAGMENIANTMAMNNTRMAWATSRHIGIETLPLMQVVLLLLMLCIFPLIAILALLPNMGYAALKNYIFSLIWLETWPIMYAILNMAMNYYLKAGNHGTVTLSNVNLLAQEHSDIAGIAGYLVLAIPFLSMGIVKGMAMTFNNAAQYLGGMMHSIAQGSSASVASGNYSLGNVSTNNATANNISANKHDTNFSNMHGLNTQQFGNATTATSTPMGQDIYSTGQGMSHLASNINASQSVASTLSSQADSSLTSAFNQSTQYSHSKGHNDSLGTNFTSGESANVNHAMNTINSMTQSLAQKEGVSTKDAFSKMTQASTSAEVHTSAEVEGGFSIGGYGVKAAAGGSLRADISGRGSSTHDGSHSISSDKNISINDAKNFSEALNTVKSYSQSHSVSDHNTESQNLAIQMGADLSHAQRLSESAQLVRNNSESFNVNFAQDFSNRIQENNPSEAVAILSATGGPMLAKQIQLEKEYIHNHAEQLVDKFRSSSSSIQHGEISASMQNRQKYATQNYQHNAGNLRSQGSGLGVNQSQKQNLSSSIINQVRENRGKINESQHIQSGRKTDLESLVDEAMGKGKAYAEKGVTRHILNGVGVDA